MACFRTEIQFAGVPSKNGLRRGRRRTGELNSAACSYVVDSKEFASSPRAFGELGKQSKTGLFAVALSPRRVRDGELTCTPGLENTMKALEKREGFERANLACAR